MNGIVAAHTLKIFVTLFLLYLFMLNSAANLVMDMGDSGSLNTFVSADTDEGYKSVCSWTPSKRTTEGNGKVKNKEKHRTEQHPKPTKMKSSVKRKSSDKTHGKLEARTQGSFGCDEIDFGERPPYHLYSDSYESMTEKQANQMCTNLLSQASSQAGKVEKFRIHENEHIVTQKLQNEDVSKVEKEDKNVEKDLKEDAKAIRNESAKREVQCKSRLPQQIEDRSHLKQDNIDSKSTIAQLETDLKKARDNVDAWEIKFKAMEKEKSAHISKIKKKCEQLERENSILTQRYDEELKNKNKLQKEKEALEQKIQRIEANKEKVETTQTVSAKQTKHTEKESLSKCIEEQTLSSHEINLDSNIVVRKEAIEGSKLQVQIFCGQNNDLMDTIMDEFATLVKSKLTSDDLELELLRGSEISEVTPTKLLFVLCISLHALDSDVKRALTGIDVTDLTAILMIHLKEPHALPSVSSDRKLTGVARTGLGGIFDMAFLRDRGMYECPMNERNVVDIVNFIRAAAMKCQTISNN